MVNEVLESHKGPKTINKELEGGKKLLSSIRTKDGAEVTNKTEITETIETFYKELYSTDKPDRKRTGKIK